MREWKSDVSARLGPVSDWARLAQSRPRPEKGIHPEMAGSPHVPVRKPMWEAMGDQLLQMGMSLVFGALWEWANGSVRRRRDGDAR